MIKRVISGYTHLHEGEGQEDTVVSSDMQMKSLIHEQDDVFCHVCRTWFDSESASASAGRCLKHVSSILRCTVVSY